jgi:adenylate cyclase class 2
MPIEIEKKYRLTQKQRDEIESRLPEIGATRDRVDFEVNALYAGESLNPDRAVLRLRRVGDRGILTYKERLPSDSPIKHQLEDETSVDDPDAMESILDAIGFVPSLVYEKRRETWRLGKAEIVIDELPFGLFMEIEGVEAEIRDIEGKLAIKRLKTETSTYPQLTRKHGTDYDGVIESRFGQKTRDHRGSKNTERSGRERVIP